MVPFHNHVCRPQFLAFVTPLTHRTDLYCIWFIIHKTSSLLRSTSTRDARVDVIDSRRSPRLRQTIGVYRSHFLGLSSFTCESRPVTHVRYEGQISNNISIFAIFVTFYLLGTTIPGEPPTRLDIWATFLGVSSATLAASQYAPQIVHTYRLRLVGALSIPMMLIQTPGAIFMVLSIALRYASCTVNSTIPNRN
jgi:hypothetical protein